MAYPVPENERDRLRALDAYDVVGTPPEMDFDEIAEFASINRKKQFGSVFRLHELNS